ncbi:MAG: hypothetical protein ACP5N2_00640 [Candidatus Nanoarchaeia archaeon]
MNKEEKQRNCIPITLSKNKLDIDSHTTKTTLFDAYLSITNGIIYPPTELEENEHVVGNRIMRQYTSTLNEFITIIRKNSGDITGSNLSSDGIFSGGIFYTNKVLSIAPQNNPGQKKQLFHFTSINSFNAYLPSHQPVHIDILDIHLREAQKVTNNLIEGKSLSYNPIKNAWVNYVQGLRYAKERIPCDITITPDSLIVINNWKQMRNMPDAKHKEIPIYMSGNVKFTLEMNLNGVILSEDYSSSVRLNFRKNL